MAQPEAAAPPPTISFPYNITIQIETTAPDVAQILLNGSSGPVEATLPEENAGSVIAHVTVTTHSGDPWTVPLELGGDDGGLFALTNAGVAPCDLAVGSESISAGSFSIKLSAPPA
jgi:hypothetical protein